MLFYHITYRSQSLYSYKQLSFFLREPQETFLRKTREGLEVFHYYYYYFFLGQDEVLQGIQAVHAGQRGNAPCTWLQEAEKDHEEVQERLSVYEKH